jgi:hypothetical protein
MTEPGPRLSRPRTAGCLVAAMAMLMPVACVGALAAIGLLGSGFGTGGTFFRWAAVFLLVLGAAAATLSLHRFATTQGVAADAAGLHLTVAGRRLTVPWNGVRRVYLLDVSTQGRVGHGTYRSWYLLVAVTDPALATGAPAGDRRFAARAARRLGVDGPAVGVGLGGIPASVEGVEGLLRSVAPCLPVERRTLL